MKKWMILISPEVLKVTEKKKKRTMKRTRSRRRDPMTATKVHVLLTGGGSRAKAKAKAKAKAAKKKPKQTKTGVKKTVEKKAKKSRQSKKTDNMIFRYAAWRAVPDSRFKTYMILVHPFDK